MSNIGNTLTYSVQWFNISRQSLSFLDVWIKGLTDGSTSTSIYRKDTFSGLYMKYNSFVPPQFKRSLVYGLLNSSHRPVPKLVVLASLIETIINL